MRPRRMVRVLEPFHHLRFAGLPQCDGVEEDIFVLLADDGDGLFNLRFAEGVERMGRGPNASDMRGSLLQPVERHDLVI